MNLRDGRKLERQKLATKKSQLHSLQNAVRTLPLSPVNQLSLLR